MKKGLVLLLVAGGMLLAGAIGSGALRLGAGASGPAAEGVSLVVTREFGAIEVDGAEAEELPAGETVMRFLQRNFEVDTRYGGGFVQSIEGLAGGSERGRRVDWFYYVNGIEAAEGAASRRVSAGDRIQWDRHLWTAAQRIPAIVGAFPEPFVSGSEGRRLPLSLVCAAEERTCDEVATRLQEAGVQGISRTGLGAGFGSEVLRIVVGPYEAIRSDPAASLLAQGPEASGVFARPRAGAIDLLDERGEVVETLTEAGGLLAATRYEDQQPTWIVTGTDDAGVAAAAAVLREEVLAGRFAVAVAEGRDVPLPVRPVSER